MPEETYSEMLARNLRPRHAEPPFFCAPLPPKEQAEWMAEEIAHERKNKALTAEAA